MSRRGISVLGLFAVAVVFAVGLTRLFTLRFAGGEIYPPGSSRRADPRGTRAFHDSLALLPGFRVTRNYERLRRTVPDPAGHTLILAGYEPELLVSPIPKTVAHDLDEFARAGGRVVLALTFGHAGAVTNSWTGARQTLRRAGKESIESEQLSTLWGFQLSRHIGGTGGAILTSTNSDLPAHLPWPGSRQFTSATDPWKILYTRDGEAVIIERSLGRGSLVLLADDFLLSNEALRNQRKAALLAWLLGPNKRVIFDEAHLGLEHSPGLASLIRRYQLGGAAMGLLLLAALYVWQQTQTFNPPPTANSNDFPPDVVPGRSAATGFHNLLRRSVSVQQLIPTLFERWKETSGRRVHPRLLAEAVDLVNLESARPPNQRQPVTTYQKLVSLLHQKW